MRVFLAYAVCIIVWLGVAVALSSADPVETQSYDRDPLGLTTSEVLYRYERDTHYSVTVKCVRGYVLAVERAGGALHSYYVLDNGVPMLCDNYLTTVSDSVE